MPSHNETEIARKWHTRYQGVVRRHANGAYNGLECLNYNPCPICYRCDNAAPSLYEKCADCPAVGCSHTVEERNMLIRR